MVAIAMDPTTIIWMFVSIVLMARPTKDKRRTAPPPPGGNLPFLLRKDEDEWFTFVVVCSDDMLEPQQNEREWSCYYVEAIDEDDEPIDDTGHGTMEIPFWAMKDFYEVTVKAYEADANQINLKCKRVKQGGRNYLRFREVK